MIDASMEETPEMMRKEIEETKLQLAEKIETLEKQVAETVKTTENAVNATVGAVQGTVHSVTAVVDNAVQSVNHFLDLQQQIDRHPFLVVGGAVVAGYLAALAALVAAKWQVVATALAVLFRNIGGPSLVSAVLRCVRVCACVRTHARA